MNETIDIQNACSNAMPFSEEHIQEWTAAVLDFMETEGELTIRLVDEPEMTNLNHQYRKINKSTNVLAFPANIPKSIPLEVPLLGDVIVCPAVLERESEDFEKPLRDHWIHIITHGILHLLGYDHIEEHDAEIMQGYEIKILAEFNIENPYET